MDLDDAIPVCHNVYGEPLDVSCMTVATHERRIIRVTYGRCGCGSYQTDG